MKKITLTFAVALLSAVNVSAKNSEIKKKASDKPLDLCGIGVTFYDSSGLAVGFKFHSSEQPTLSSCQNYQQSVIANYIRKGYIITGPALPIEDIH